MTTGFVLLKTEIGQEKKIKSLLEKIPEVKDVRILYGEFDALVTVEAGSTTELARVIVEKVRAVPGIKSTRTHVEVKI